MFTRKLARDFLATNGFIPLIGQTQAMGIKRRNIFFTQRARRR
ncbi:Uncharacterised protein [Vibrio cholerae]|nr:Uncharacterised protein [Vibrio cholerae]